MLVVLLPLPLCDVMLFFLTFVQFLNGLGLLPHTTQQLGLPIFNEQGVLTTSVVVPKTSLVVVARTPILSVERDMGNFQGLPLKLIK